MHYTEEDLIIQDKTIIDCEAQIAAINSSGEKRIAIINKQKEIAIDKKAEIQQWLIDNPQ